MMKIFVYPLICLNLLFQTLYSQSLTVEKIIQNIDQNIQVSASKSSSKQTIVTAKGNQRTLSAIAYSKDKNDKQLMIYTAPKRVKGDKILILDNGDNIWFYTPKTERIRHLASHARRNKVQGSDFSYEDIASGNYGKNYTSRLLGEEKMAGRDCYKLELIPTKDGPHYAKIIIWADKVRFVTLQSDYYEKDDPLPFKRLNYDEIHSIKNHWYPLKMTMRNLRENSETRIEILDIQLDIQLDNQMFTSNYLKKR